MNGIEDILSAAKVAEILNAQYAGKRKALGEEMISKAIREGELRGRKVGTKYFTTVVAVLEWIGGKP